jgi:hypothetical protein
VIDLAGMRGDGTDLVSDAGRGLKGGDSIANGETNVVSESGAEGID